ncbi:MAG: hypothetical protein JW888_17605 [Pirellulales bacterium]|nr:hypothetical protein [Pirellulales bacterium]
MPSRTRYPSLSADKLIAKDKIIDLTGNMNAEGRLTWRVPLGRWTIVPRSSPNPAS